MKVNCFKLRASIAGALNFYITYNGTKYQVTINILRRTRYEKNHYWNWNSN